MGSKGVDKGNRRRGIKNLMRFLKNPIGYVAWKSSSFSTQYPKTMTLGFLACWFFSIYQWKVHSNSVKSQDLYYLQLGKNVEGSVGRMKGLQHSTPLRGNNLL